MFRRACYAVLHMSRPGSVTNREQSAGHHRLFDCIYTYQCWSTLDTHPDEVICSNFRTMPKSRSWRTVTNLIIRSSSSAQSPDAHFRQLIDRGGLEVWSESSIIYCAEVQATNYDVEMGMLCSEPFVHAIRKAIGTHHPRDNRFIGCLYCLLSNLSPPSKWLLHSQSIGHVSYKLTTMQNAFLPAKHLARTRVCIAMVLFSTPHQSIAVPYKRALGLGSFAATIIFLNLPTCLSEAESGSKKSVPTVSKWSMSGSHAV